MPTQLFKSALAINDMITNKIHVRTIRPKRVAASLCAHMLPLTEAVHEPCCFCFYLLFDCWLFPCHFLCLRFFAPHFSGRFWHILHGRSHSQQHIPYSSLMEQPLSKLQVHSHFGFSRSTICGSRDAGKSSGANGSSSL